MTKTKLNDLSIEEARLGLDNKEFSSVELTKAHIEAMEKNRGLNIFVTETPELALEQAKKSDEKIARGNAGILEGIPLAIKDNYCTNGVLTTAASEILNNFIPPYESTITSKLFEAGGIMIGKTNMDEFAMGSSNTQSAYGPVISPIKNKVTSKDLTPGGSSGGSAAAVAAGVAIASIGSDTGGSVRQPASFCGIVGMKPTYGRCSRFGMIAFASSLDQASPFGKNVKDTSLMLQAMMGYDAKDSTSAKVDVPNLSEAFKDNDLKGMKIGVPKEYNDNLPTEIKKMWEAAATKLNELGAETIEISLPHTHYGLGAYYIIASAEASSNLSRYDGVRYGLRKGDGKGLSELYKKTRSIGFGPEVKRRIMIGTYVLSRGHYEDTYLQAQKIRNLIIDDFANSFKKVDAILTPTCISDAFALDKKLSPVEMYKNDLFTIPTSLAGLPGISIPGGLSKDGLPLGLQIIGNSFDEITVLKIAQALEKAIGFKLD